MTKNIKDELSFVYCPTCGEEGCCIAEPEGGDLDFEVVLYWSCENKECRDYGKDLEPSREWWARYYKEEQVAMAEMEEAELARLFEEDEKEFFESIKGKSPEEIEKENWPTVVNVGMDPDVTAEVCEGYQK